MRSLLPSRLLLICVMALAGCLLGGVAYARECEREIPPVGAPPPSVLILMDASKSMSKPAGDGRTRLQAAKSALRALIEGLPNGTRVGLRLYGHRVSGATRAEGCRDTELVAPVGELDRRALGSEIDSYEAVGSTPIGRALRAAAADLPAEGLTSIVLVSDGGDNCAPPSPCAVAGQIAGRGTGLSVQAIGFQVTGRAREQLRCIAERGRGIYRDAGDADELAVALRALAARATRTFALTGSPIEGGASERHATPISSGRFLDRIGPGEERWYRVALRTGQRLAASSALIVTCPPATGALDSLGTNLTLEARDSRGLPDAINATGNLFLTDLSVESVGVLTAPVAAGTADQTRLLRVEFNEDPDGGLAKALGGGPVALRLEVNVIGRGAVEPAAAVAKGGGGDGGLGVAASIAVVVGCLLLGALSGAFARRRRAGSAS